MIQTAKEVAYDPKKDMEPVNQTGWINLYDAYETHTIPSIIDDNEVSYNEIDNPAEILGKPSDIFEATRMSSYINEVGRKESSGESEVA